MNLEAACCLWYIPAVELSLRTLDTSNTQARPRPTFVARRS